MHASYGPSPHALAFAAVLTMPCGGCTLLFPVGEFDSGEAHGASERCSDPNVVRCVGFDSDAEMKSLYASEPCGQIDHATFASGEGSVRMTVSAQGAVGFCAVNFHPKATTEPPGIDGMSFGPGETFFVHWRMRYDAAALGADYGGENARDQAFLGPGDENGAPTGDSAAGFAIVVNSMNQRNLPTLRASGLEVTPSSGATDFLLQNQVEGCTYQYQQVCEHLVADTWMTFQVAVTVGHDGAADSRLRVWFGVEGSASVPIIDVDGVLLASDMYTKLAYGKLWLWPQVEAPGSTPAEVGHVWYDDVVISRAFVPDP